MRRESDAVALTFPAARLREIHPAPDAGVWVIHTQVGVQGTLDCRRDRKHSHAFSKSVTSILPGE